MSKNKQRTRIYDLNYITGSIQLPNFNGAFQQDDTELIAPPKMIVDVTEVKKGIKVVNALLIVKEQMRLWKGK
ncbi:hypothetical protein OL548_26410 [Lysinibacillus sp. MHQ-1]|nr:hypothetical protein OL548_26410 [Lysinibacillus sp. MHQ-1]